MVLFLDDGNVRLSDECPGTVSNALSINEMGALLTAVLSPSSNKRCDISLRIGSLHCVFACRSDS
jgi:hypothetical protein